VAVMTERGIEKIEFADPETGRTIWRLTNNNREEKHTYYDINPWSSDEKYILFSSARGEDLTLQVRDMRASDKGEVYVIDTEDYGIKQVGDEALFTTHNGASAMWHPSEDRIYYYHVSGQVAAVNPVTGERERLMDGNIRQLSPDGERFVWNNNDPNFEDGRGIYTMREDGSDVIRLVSDKELLGLTPNRDEIDFDTWWIQNPKWSPDGQQVMLATLMRKPIVMHKHLYIVQVDGSEKRWLTDYGHHHDWLPDGSGVLYSDWWTRVRGEEVTGGKADARVFVIDADGTNRRPFIDKPLGGHPAIDPSGTMLATWDETHVLLVQAETETIEQIATLKPGFDMTHGGTHPHCVWKPDGTQILYNSAQTGNSQLYLIPMNG